MHHAGALIALQFQARAGEARLDTLLFGWLWAIHAFGLFAKVQSKLVALTIGKEYCASEGQRSVVLDGAKHIYSLVTVRLIYDYLNAPGQPGLGVRNYQTWAVCVMLTGRYLVNDNCRNIDFFRRVEAPGAALVFLDHLLFRDPHLDRACAILLTALAGLVTHAVFLAQHRPKPARYHGPAEHEELRDFLDEATPRVLEREQEPPSSVVAAWFATQKTAGGEAFATAYPALAAIVAGDAKALERHLLDDPSRADSPNTDWHDSRPLHWSTVLQRADATLHLLKHGANPYAIEKNTGKDAVDKGLTGVSAVLSGKASPGELGGCSDFWARLDGLCVARSPPAVDWARLSVGTRIRRVIAKF